MAIVRRTFADQKPRRPHLVAGQGGLSGEIWDLRRDITEAFEEIYAELDSSVTVLDNNTLLVSGKLKLNFQGQGVTVTPDPEDPMQVNISLAGFDGNLTQIYTPNVGNTDALAPGYFAYQVTATEVLRTDARYPANSATIGAYNNIPGSLVRDGILPLVFSAASPFPQVGDPIFLARGDDEPDDAAIGKVTTKLPPQGFVCPVGQVSAVNAAQFMSGRVATCIINILPRTFRP